MESLQLANELLHECWNKGLILVVHVVLSAAPSMVGEVVKEKVQQRSIQLSWQEPRQLNGAITEYEIKYYKKVGKCFSYLILSTV